MSQTDPNTNIDQKQGYEELQVMGEQLLGRVRELMHQGNVRRIIIKQSDGRTVLEIPLTVGLVGALVAPQVAAIGAIGALLAQCSIQIVRSESPSEVAREKVDEVVNPNNYDRPSAI